MTVLGQGALRVAAGSTDDPSPAREPTTVSEEPASAEPNSFDEWALARWPALVRFAWLTTGNSHDAQDAAQDALVGVYPRWSELNAAGTVEAYARRSVVNSSISRWRKGRRREDPGPPPVVPTGRGDVEPDLAAALTDADHAWQLCHQLPPQQRAAVVLRFYEDLSFAEIGDVLGCPETTARSHVHRALASLRATLEQGDSHD